MTRKRPQFTPAQRLKCFEDHGAIVCCQGEDCDSAIYIKGCSIDHWLALIDGGKHEQSNFRPLCFLCHSKKSAREHRNNAKCKRVAKKHSGQVEEAKPKQHLSQGRRLRGRANPWPEWRGEWPKQKFQKRKQTAAAE